MAGATVPEAGGDRHATLVVHQRVEQLLASIQPNKQSEFRRLTIANYVINLIKSNICHAGQVEAFMFGSVPLRTYLPDGDIDISVFSSPTSRGDTGMLSLKDTWASQLLKALEAEQARPDAPFRIRDLQIIQAEVKLVKCVVADLVVDVSFETLGGLCTVAFLESIDRKIGRAHLFKRSIVLVKAWCYYESRLLGAHHGLISSYALEAMVLYVFNLHHRELNCPMEVLCKFLEVFSAFNWDQYCLSLQGPIPLNTFPNPVVDTHGIHPGSLLLDPPFLEDVLAKYSVQPASGHGPAHFVLKHLNIVDPLLPSNNLGRSVSKASFARIRRAFAHGANAISQIVCKDPRSAIEGIDLFFKNTWKSPMRLAADNHAFMQRLGLGSMPYHIPMAPAYSATLHSAGSGGMDGLSALAQPAAPTAPIQHQQPAPPQPPQSLQQQPPAPQPHQPPQQAFSQAAYIQMLNGAMRQHQQHQQRLLQQQAQLGPAGAARHTLEALAQSLQQLQMQQSEQASPHHALQYAASLSRAPTAPPLPEQQQHQQQQEVRGLERRHSFGSLAQLRASNGSNASHTAAAFPIAAAGLVSTSSLQAAGVPAEPSTALLNSTCPLAPPATAAAPSSGQGDGPGPSESTPTADAAEAALQPCPAPLLQAPVPAAPAPADPAAPTSPSEQEGSADVALPLPLPEHAPLPRAQAAQGGLAPNAPLPASRAHPPSQLGTATPAPMPMAAAAVRPSGRQYPIGNGAFLSEEALSALLAGGHLHAATAPNTPTTPATVAAAAAASAALQAPAQTAPQQLKPPAPAAPKLPPAVTSNGALGNATVGVPHAGLLGSLAMLHPYQLQALAGQPQLLQTLLTDPARAGTPYWFAAQAANAGMRLPDGQPAAERSRASVDQPTALPQLPQALQGTELLPAAAEAQQQVSPQPPPNSDAPAPSGPAGVPAAAGQPADIFTGDLLSLSQNLDTARSCQQHEKPPAPRRASRGGSGGGSRSPSKGPSDGSKAGSADGASSSVGRGSPVAVAEAEPAGAASPADRVEAARASLPQLRTSSSVTTAGSSAAAAAVEGGPSSQVGSGSTSGPAGLQQPKTPTTTRSSDSPASTPPNFGQRLGRPEGASPARSTTSSAWGRALSSGASTPKECPPGRRSWSDIAASTKGLPQPPLPLQQQHQRGSGEFPRPQQERLVARVEGGVAAGGARSSKASSEVGSDGTPRATAAPGKRQGRHRMASSPRSASTWSLADAEFPSLGGDGTADTPAAPATRPSAWGPKRDQLNA